MTNCRSDRASSSGRDCPSLSRRTRQPRHRNGGQARPRNGRCATLMIFALLSAPAAGQDTVYIAGSAGGQTRITGRVLDYNGRELRLEHTGGKEQSFPAERVLRVETEYGRQQTEADGLFARHHFDRALVLYVKAVDGEPRRWVRRQIIARIVCCHSALEQTERAGEAFLLLIREDPDTPQFDCIPLVWISRETPIALEAAARRWLGRSEPAARLLGASHLLAGRDRPAALKELHRLAAGADRQVAALALAQSWRAKVVTATAEQIDAWGELIQKMPEPIAAGPYFLLGLARAQRQRPEQAALAVLRVAILYPQRRALAAQSLLEAGRVLEGLDRKQSALRLYRELIRDYPERTRAVAEARARLEEIANSQ